MAVTSIFSGSHEVPNASSSFTTIAKIPFFHLSYSSDRATEIFLPSHTLKKPLSCNKKKGVCRENNAQGWLTQTTAHHRFSSTAHTFCFPPALRDCQMTWGLPQTWQSQPSPGLFPQDCPDATCESVRHH